MTSSEPLTLTSTLAIPSSSSTTTTNRIPRLGFGVYQSSGEICYNACLTALRTGYRHIDSAQYYANETQVGRAVRDSGVPREDVYLTTKILGALGAKKDDVQKTYESLVGSVERMNCLEEGELADISEETEETEAGAGAGTDTVAGSGSRAAAAAEKRKRGYVDLFLIHSPFSGEMSRRTMWLALEKAKRAGLAREIGVSNYGRKYIEEMRTFEGATVFPPAVNQIELHPWCQQRTAVSYCLANNIVIEAYCPIVRNRKSSDPTLLSITKNYSGKSTTQVLIRYCLQKGWVPLPKSDTPERIEANADVFDFELSKEDMNRLDALDDGVEGAIVCAVEN